ncbi:invertebrate-type lysozyme 2-like [Tachypleus tridentatus]|uniref:invertebrate-type lysozyme 2-like n=1 Tax=Tachypleus tridentatus TaxID=6853 RepID=UPI003FD6A3D3
MVKMQKFFVCEILAVVAVFVQAQQNQLVSNDCLYCLCQASSGCNFNKECHNDGGTNYFCGGYVISYGYWKDGGSPGFNPSNPHDFEVCLKDKQCAEAAVEGYMRKWKRDCDRDGQITCNDFARIHKAGPYGCNGTWVLGTQYWTRFKECYRY